MIFFAQNSAFFLGITRCSGQPCQKHPSTNTASRAPGKIKSGRPGRDETNRYRIPCLQSSLLSLISGPVFRPLFRDMQKLRWSGVRTSVKRQPSFVFVLPSGSKSDFTFELKAARVDGNAIHHDLAGQAGQIRKNPLRKILQIRGNTKLGSLPPD